MIFGHLSDRKLDRIIHLLEALMSDQSHLDADVAADTAALASLAASFDAVLAALKAQPGASALNFAAADAFVASITATAATDAGEVPPA